MQLAAGRVNIRGRSSPLAGYSIRAPAAPMPSNVPGMYGGPPGSFITTSRCPTGYEPVKMSRAIGSGPQTTRCVPIPRPVIPAPQVTPQVTIAPTFTQEFTPQFSPVVQQQQDSPGAGQSAAPVQEVVPTVITAPVPAPISDSYQIPSTLPVPSPVPSVITAPTPVPEVKSFLPDLKNMKENYLPLILVAGIAALFYGKKK